MAAKFGGRRLLPLTYIFGSFFGAAMIAVVFAYNNYRFSKFKFVDFSDLIFYQKSEIFSPTQQNYTLVVFSSAASNLDQILNQTERDFKILALDIAQKRPESNASVQHISSDINTILKLLFTLNISQLPSSVKLIHQKDKIYKQDSKILNLKG